LDAGACTIEEREEYEPLIMSGTTVYAGVDYAEIVAAAEAESDVILWDGGNNDFPFIRPDLHIVLSDPLRPGDERQYYPGDAALRMADIIVVAKANVAKEANIQQVIENARTMNSEATIIRGASQVALDKPEAVKGKRVLVVEDGPTITHGGMGFGAGYIAAKDAGAAEIVDPRGAARGEMAGIFARFPHIGTVLPAMGYHPTQCRELEQTINASDADVIVAGTPCDLDALLSLDKPVVRARYDYADLDTPGLGDMVEKYLGRALREKS
jgi:predicted GTPase